MSMLYLHSTVPSLSASSRSPAGSRSPSVSSIQARTSLAACGVYLPMRRFFMSWSRLVTDAILVLYQSQQRESVIRWLACCRSPSRWG
jgi:hypothetical protein